MSNPVSQLDYLKMTGWQKFCYKFLEFFRRLPIVFVNFFKVTIPSFALLEQFKRLRYNRGQGCKVRRLENPLIFRAFRLFAAGAQAMAEGVAVFIF